MNLVDKVHKTKNRVDKDKVLSVKNPAMFKTRKITNKYPFDSNPSGYLQGGGIIT